MRMSFKMQDVLNIFFLGFISHFNVVAVRLQINIEGFAKPFVRDRKGEIQDSRDIIFPDVLLEKVSRNVQERLTRSRSSFCGIQHQHPPSPPD